VDDTHSARANPFGAARPVDTDSALKKVEEKLAKEKLRDQKEDSSSTRRPSMTTTPAPPSAGARPQEKQRQQPKQLLRRTQHGAAASSNSTQTVSDPIPVTGAKSEISNEPLDGTDDASWRRKSEVDPSSLPEEEPGWETVPARGKKVNGVGVKH